MTFTRNTATLVLMFAEDHLAALRLNGAPASPFQAPLALNPLTDDPQLVAQEWRDRLQPLGRLPRNVVVGAPLNRLMISAAAVPELPPGDLDSFLWLQAEREFLLSPEEIAMGVAVSSAEAGAHSALLAALPIRQYTNLTRSLRLAGLKQVRVIPIPAGAMAVDSATQVRLLVGRRGCDLLATAAGELLLLRRLGSMPADANASGPDLAALDSELRISLRQLPRRLLQELTTLEVVGEPEQLPPVVAAVQRALAGSQDHRHVQITPVAREALSFCCEQVAHMIAAGREPGPDIKPTAGPRRWHSFDGWRRRDVRTGAGTAAAMLLLGLGMVIYQDHQLTALRREWQALSPRVTAIREIIDLAKTRQAWFSDQPESLGLLRVITLAFPTRPTVWATRIEITGQRQAMVTGNATSRDAWLQTLEALRKTAGVADVRVAQARESADGKSQLSFSFSFSYQPPPPGAPGVESQQ